MSEYLLLFVIIILGYLFGSIKVKGISLSTSAILLVAIVFGHFGFQISNVIKNIGLACFVAATGFAAGPSFFKNFKKQAAKYILIGLLIVLLDGLICVIVLSLTDIPTPLAIGIFTGAATSTPGLAAASEATNSPLAAIGYGIGYPFGVVGMVLLVQLLPKFLKAGKYMAKNNDSTVAVDNDRNMIAIDHLGLFPLACAIVLGILLAKINIPLPGGGKFNFGIAGGPMIIALIMGKINHLGRISLQVNKETIKVIREFGLALFLSAAGVEAGSGLVVTLKEYGIVLFILGALITLIPSIIGFIVAYKGFKFGCYDALSTVCGGQTSTPSLGALINVAGNDDVASGYAITYPVSLVFIVLITQFISVLFK